MEDLNLAIDLNPSNAVAYGNRGILKKIMQDYIGAMEDLTKQLN